MTLDISSRAASSAHSPRALLQEAFAVAVEAVSPCNVMAPYFPPLGDSRRSVLVAVGKAAASMTKATFDHYGRSLPGIVLTRYGHGLSDLRTIPGLSVIEAGHPVPDDAGRRAAALVLELAQSLGQGDHLLFLVSGGGSSLLSLPAPGLSLEDKQKVTRALLACGASITELNCVRKHLSAIKGGRLALAAAPARVTTLVISDVAGDDASMVASGPTFPDSTTLQNARRILELYNIDPGAGVREALSNPNNETPSVDNPAFATAQARIVARAKGALAAAGQFLAADGYTPLYLGDDVEGDATEVGTVHAALALHHRGKRGRFALISGGELTVAVRDNAGAGGPNSEYLMSLACALNGAEGVSAIACDTDGIDGTADNAGAVIDSSTLRRARALGLDFPAQLAANRSYATFQALGDLIVTGPTRTNVNDFRVILVEGRS